ncbi:MAG: CRTAC1 family protein [Pirellulaceae bacterium]|jgi:hypothetical protein|nr:CRTAC1 family protein [Pirellulaceae bacterium]MDP7017523.1 CRTAC1 family protein [Pirellulaceae bacterium]
MQDSVNRHPARRRGIVLVAATAVCFLLAVAMKPHCAEADDIRALSFTDVTLDAGTGGPTAEGKLGGHGAMWADVDGDRRPDLYITMIFRNPMPDLFFKNVDGSRFVDAGRRFGIDDMDGGSHGACFADLDNDGDYDLFNGTTWDHPQHPCFNNLFRNDGERFADVTKTSGIPSDRTWPTRGVIAFDMDGDGDLDLFGVTNYQGSRDPPGELNELYRNEGGFHFTPVNSGEALTAPCGQGVTDTDFDGDGDIDLIAANRTGPVNILRNNGRGVFKLTPPASIGIRHRAADGVTMGDVDNDGDLDMILAGADVGHLYINGGRGVFAHRRSFEKVDGYMAGCADLDNDGDLDLVFAGDDVSYINDGAGNFKLGPGVPVAGIDDPRGVAFADFDGDGDLDFAIGCKRSRNWLVRNNLDKGNWLKVELISSDGQAGAFGARVKVLTPGGKSLISMREARSNNGYLGQNDPVLHFGLGDHQTVDVEVRFLNGEVVTRSHQSARRTILVDARQK